MVNRSLSYFLLAIFAGVCLADNRVGTTQQPYVKEGTPLEIAIVLGEILAATTLVVTVVLVPTIIYHNYNNKQGDDSVSAMIH